MKGEKDALLMLAHRKENCKKVPNGLGFTVTHGSAMGNHVVFSLFCNAAGKESEASQTKCCDNDTPQVPTGTLQ